MGDMKELIKLAAKVLIKHIWIQATWTKLNEKGEEKLEKP